ncbi:hypothetical protein PM082_011055 [Marasmius tenuissimus]|nr:hypothetical protein PM082_011055 [Marasmius tenuissimus]
MEGVHVLLHQVEVGSRHYSKGTPGCFLSSGDEIENILRRSDRSSHPMKPSLWRPVGFGEQTLYDSDVKVKLLDKENSSSKAYWNPNSRVPSGLACGARPILRKLHFFP